MYTFEIVNFVAVFGTALLMMAIATVWYSKMVLERLNLTAAAVKEAHSVSELLLIGVGFFIALAFIAYAVAVAPLLGHSPLRITFGIFILFSSLQVATAVREGRSIQNQIPHIVFSMIFILGGALTLQYWPW